MESEWLLNINLHVVMAHSVLLPPFFSCSLFTGTKCLTLFLRTALTVIPMRMTVKCVRQSFQDTVLL